MVSTFHSLETARRGMTAQQSALYTTSNNIANANTPGYTRQRVNFAQTTPYAAPGMNSAVGLGQIGSGVAVNSIERVRESFLDVQYRTAQSKSDYWQTRAESLTAMEDIMNEPSDSGLAKTMDQFWQALQDLSVHPDDHGARAVVKERGKAVAETFNHLSASLSSVRDSLKQEMDATQKEINAILHEIHNVNKQITDIEHMGELPNNLYDERDQLLDQLSGFVQIQVEYKPTGGNASPIAEGAVIVKLAGVDAAETLVGENGVNELSISYNSDNGAVEKITVGSAGVAASDFNSVGQLKALMESYGYDNGSGGVSGVYPDMLAKLDELAFTFATEFNKANDNTAFFTQPSSKEGFAGTIAVSSGGTIVGNASALANVMNEPFEFGNGEKTDIRSYYKEMIGTMAAETQQASRLAKNSDTLRESADNRRKSISEVSIDEEMTNMIRFQHAYNAAARMITVTDEMLDKIINGMGLVGR